MLRRDDERRRAAKLLAWTYLDAVEAGAGAREHVSHGKASSKDQMREVLWYRGSYKQLERALDSLRRTSRTHYRELWLAYIQAVITPTVRDVATNRWPHSPENSCNHSSPSAGRFERSL